MIVLDKGWEHVFTDVSRALSFSNFVWHLFHLAGKCEGHLMWTRFLLWASDLIRQRMRTCLHRFIQSTQLFQICLALGLHLAETCERNWMWTSFLLWASDSIRQRVRTNVLTYLFPEHSAFSILFRIVVHRAEIVKAIWCEHVVFVMGKRLD